MLQTEEITLPLPTGESEFTRDDPSKNFVKVVIDDERNKPFIEEMKQKLAACHNETDYNTLKENFKRMTGIDFDTICLPEKKPNDTSADTASDITVTEVEKTPQQENVDTSNDVMAVPVPETDELTKKDMEYHQNTLMQLDMYLENPSLLRFTEEEIQGMIKIGAFDRNTMNIVIEQLNNDVDAIIAGKTDPTSPYYDEARRREAIKDTLEIKIRSKEAVDAQKEFEDTGIAQKVFDKKFSEYATQGPAWILESFKKYLDSRTETDAAKSFLYNELNDSKKLHDIIARANKLLFSGMLTTNNKEYTIGNFVGSMLRWNRSRLALLAGIEEDEVTLERFDSPLLVLSVLFVRQWYKHYTPNIQDSSIEKRLFYQFVRDNANPATISTEKYEAMDAAWKDVLSKCAEISIECTKVLKAQAMSNT